MYPRPRRCRLIRTGSRGQAHGVEDLLVAGAAAEVAGERLADLVVATGRGVRASRSAAATTSPGVQKPHCTAPASTKACLHRVEPVAVGEPLDRRHVVTVGLRREDEAGADEHAVEQHRARAALALLARVLRARVAELLAQREEQRLALPAVGLGPTRR